MTIDAFAGRMRRVRPSTCTRCVRIRARCRSPRNLRQLLAGSTLADIAYHLVPRSGSGCPTSWDDAGAAGAALRHRLGLGAARRSATAARRFYQRFQPFRGGKKHQPQDSYSLRCIPQVHGAVRDALAQAQARARHRTECGHRQSAGVPGLPGAQHIEDQVISAGHFHGMPLALAMSYLKAAIPVLASISERRLNKLVDPATNDGLPAFLIGNEDGTESRLHDRAVHRRGDRQRPGQPRASGLGVFDPDQRQCRGPRLDGRQRGAPRAGDDRRPGARCWRWSSTPPRRRWTTAAT